MLRKLPKYQFGSIYDTYGNIGMTIPSNTDGQFMLNESSSGVTKTPELNPYAGNMSEKPSNKELFSRDSLFAGIYSFNEGLRGLSNIHKENKIKSDMTYFNPDNLAYSNNLSSQQRYGKSFFQDGGSYEEDESETDLIDYLLADNTYTEPEKIVTEEEPVFVPNVENQEVITPKFKGNKFTKSRKLREVSQPKNESSVDPYKYINQYTNTNTNTNYSVGDYTNSYWASAFKSAEDVGSVFNHGNGAYGSFGFRKTGHLGEAFKAPEFKEIKSVAGSYNNL
jgi:hypothetical protein